MTKLFFDNLIAFEEVEVIIKKTTSSNEEKEELWGLVDELVNHKVVEKILDKLPRQHHEEFLALVHECPHDEVIVFEYLNGKVGHDVREELQNELKGISADILHELRTLDEISSETKVSDK